MDDPPKYNTFPAFTRSFRTSIVSSMGTVDFPKFARHLIALKCNSMRGVYERQTIHSLYTWLKRYKEPSPRQADSLDLSAENAKLKADLRRMTEERVTQRKIYTTREDAKTEIFNFIEIFYDPVKRHGYTGGVSPVKFEEDYYSRLESV